jgi:Subtilase family
MPDLPALPLAPPTRRRRTTRAGFRPTLRGPGAQTQAQRLGTPLRRLTEAFEAGRLAVAEDPAALEPEQVLVLEIAGELDDFVGAVANVPGLEFLAEEFEEEKVEPDEFAAVDKDGRRHAYRRELFLVASDHTAWQQLLSLWRRFERGEQFPQGLTPFRHLFERLRVLRAWDDRDRLERTGVLRAWEQELTDVPDDELVPFEAELWLRRDEQRRTAALAQLRAGLRAEGGELVQSLVHEQIGYHGVLGRAPARLLREAVARHEMRWLRTDDVRFFHAVGQIAAPAEAHLEPEPLGREPPPSLPAGGPRVALLDGVPLANHALLGGRIVVDDPDGWEATTPAARRVHGTSMASLVIHGDLGAEHAPLTTPLYTRPILRADAPTWVRDAREELPRDRLGVDVVHQAVARLFEGDIAAAPNVRIIVLAVGDAALRFDRFVSPLARLLDWLSFRYSVLFLVAAGNHLDPLNIPEDTGLEDPQELQHELLCDIQRSATLRRLLSPAESVNALTVGAAHSDESINVPVDDRVEPFITADLPSVISAVGSGVRRAVKPDLLLPGGRQLVRLEPLAEDGQRLVTIPPSTRAPGVRVAAPGTQAGALAATVYATGTSVATALGGYHAGHLLDTLATLRAFHGEAMPGEDLDSVLLKAALVHTARWGTARALIDQAQQELGRQRGREAVARIAGYGHANPNSALVCDDHRATVIAAGRITDDEAHVYRFPLPPSLNARAEHRRVTLTLAWLTPINPFHRAYRRAALTIEPLGFKDLLGDRADASMYGARRGTVQHEVLEGRRAVPYAPGSALELAVSCRADAGTLDEAVPYAVIVTLEVPQAVALPIYEEIRQALRVPVAVRAAGR